MSYIRKTRDEYRLYVDYGQGWEHELSEDTRKEIREQVKVYQENCPQYPTKWNKVRVKIDDNKETGNV